MASPESFNVRNISGDYVVDKALSDDLDPGLLLWGTNWFLRLILRHTDVIGRVETSIDEQGVLHHNLLHTAPGGLQNAELLTLNNQPFVTKDAVFGKVKRQAKLINRKDVSDAFLLKGWEDFDGELAYMSGSKESGRATETYEEVYGFQKINGSKYFVKNMILRNQGKDINIQLVYSYKGDSADSHKALQKLISLETAKQ